LASAMHRASIGPAAYSGRVGNSQRCYSHLRTRPPAANWVWVKCV